MASNHCSSRWDTSPTVHAMYSPLPALLVKRVLPSTWLCMEAASAITASVKLVVCAFMNFAICANVSEIAISGCSLYQFCSLLRDQLKVLLRAHYARLQSREILNVSKTTREILTNAEFGALDDAVIELPGKYPPRAPWASLCLDNAAPTRVLGVAMERSLHACFFSW